MPAAPQIAMNSAVRPLPEAEDSPRRGGVGLNTVPTTKKLYAVEEVRRMHGGSQSHLMRCSDGNYYVVKFQNNPQHRRILVNELLGTSLAGLLGLPTAAVAIIEVSEELVLLTPDLCMEMVHTRIPCQAGLQFGSRYPEDPHHLTLLDYLPDKQVLKASNLSHFVGMLVFDTWTCNTDGRQVIFGRPAIGTPYQAWMIDQGFCFNAGKWNFPDAPRRSLHLRNVVYQQVLGIESFEPWLAKLEYEIGMQVLLGIAKTIPPEWYEFDSESLHRLLEQLECRRRRVRELLWSVWKASPHAFPNWTQ
jgi:HipA-like protein